MKCTVDHIGIAVASLADALAFYRDELGLEIEARNSSPRRASARTLSCSIAAAPSPRGVTLELLEAAATDSPIARYIARRGPGIHHIALRVPDLVATLDQLKARGVRLIDEAPPPWCTRRTHRLHSSGEYRTACSSSSCRADRELRQPRTAPLSDGFFRLDGGAMFGVEAEGTRGERQQFEDFSKFTVSPASVRRARRAYSPDE